MTKDAARISLAGSSLGDTRHVCAFFTSDDEEYRVLFGGDAVIDIMRTHPMVIVGGMLQQKPFYVPPEQFLPEFRQRRAKQALPGPAGV
jgi:hypothetical protein